MTIVRFPKVERNPQADEPLLLAALRNYWLAQCGDREMPSRADIVPTDIKYQLPHVLLVDVIGSGQDFRYRLVGSRLHASFPSVPTGKLMSEMLAPFGKETQMRTIKAYRDVVQARAPLRLRGAGAVYSQNSKYFDAVLMPLSDDGKRVNMIFGGYFFDWDHAHEYREPDPQSWTIALNG